MEMYPSVLSADTTQQTPITEGMIVLLYRRPRPEEPGASGQPYTLRYSAPLILLHGVSLYCVGNELHPLLQYSDILDRRIILVPVDATPELTEAIAAHDRQRSAAATAKETTEMVEQMVKEHPLYTSLLKDHERLVAEHAALETEKRDRESFYGVDAILSYTDERRRCYNRGTIQHHYEDMECPTCNGRGYLHSLYWREPGDDPQESETLASGSNLRTVWSEAMAEARKRGWKHILTPDGKRKKVTAPRRIA